MAKTIDELHDLLADHGYACKRMYDVIVATRVPTQIYKDPAGDSSLEILVTLDQPNDCVAVEIRKAFSLGKAAHPEAFLRCIMTAVANTPRLRPALEPEGDIRLRIDCTCDEDGARESDVLRAVALLPAFADAWYPQLVAAMHQGTFDASAVAKVELPAPAGLSPRPAAAAACDPGSEPDGDPDGEPEPFAKPEAKSLTEPASASRRLPFCDLIRAAKLTERPGGTPHRLQTLMKFHAWLAEHDRRPGDLKPGDLKPGDLN